MVKWFPIGPRNMVATCLQCSEWTRDPIVLPSLFLCRWDTHTRTKGSLLPFASLLLQPASLLHLFSLYRSAVPPLFQNTAALPFPFTSRNQACDKKACRTSTCPFVCGLSVLKFYATRTRFLPFSAQPFLTLDIMYEYICKHVRHKQW